MLYEAYMYMCAQMISVDRGSVHETTGIQISQVKGTRTMQPSCGGCTTTSLSYRVYLSSSSPGPNVSAETTRTCSLNMAQSTMQLTVQ